MAESPTAATAATNLSAAARELRSQGLPGLAEWVEYAIDRCITDDLSLADLAVRLRDAGYDADEHTATRDGKLHVGRPEQAWLVVAAKEPPPTSNDELRRLAAKVLRQGPPIDPTP